MFGAGVGIHGDINRLTQQNENLTLLYSKPLFTSRYSYSAYGYNQHIIQQMHFVIQYT
jgi:hypothetical protein